MEQDIIRINLFDEFSITKGDEQILKNLSGTRKTKLFVAYLLVNRDRAIPHKELFDLLWSGEEFSNPGTALRTLLYRFRTMLESEQAGQLDNAVISRRGTYQWNKNLDVEIDVLEFEKMANAGMSLTYSENHRMECLSKAVALYKGQLLPDFKSEPWMISKATYYRDLYARVVEEYIKLLKKRDKYLDIVDISQTALGILGSSELIELEGTMARLSMVSGNGADAELEKYYDKVYELTSNLYDDAKDVQADLEDDTVEQKAFVCDYNTFKEIYRLQRRMQARTKSTMFLGLVDIRITEEDESDEKSLGLIMQEIVECCAYQLRCGDAVCQRKEAQLAILFPADSYDDAIGVLERLKRVSKERTGKKAVIVYNLRTLKNAREN